jgi:hypothetical protein
MENFCYEAIYDILKDPAHYAAKAVALKRLKAKIVRLNSVQQRGVLLDNAELGKIMGEDVSVYHYITSFKHQKACMVNLIHDQEGSPKRLSVNILRAFSTQLRQKYDHIHVTDESKC